MTKSINTTNKDKQVTIPIAIVIIITCGTRLPGRGTSSEMWITSAVSCGHNP